MDNGILLEDGVSFLLEEDGVSYLLEETPQINYGNVVAGSVSLPSGVNSTFFYARWVGYLVPTVTGAYTIGVNSQDGCNLFLGSEPLFTSLTASQSANSTLAYTESATVDLTAGLFYPFILEWQHGSGADFQCQLAWTPPLGTIQVIPTSSLSDETDTVSGVLQGTWWNGTPSIWYPSGSSYVDPSGPGVLAKGGIPPIISGGFSYSSTTSAITWSWTGLEIYRADDTITSITNSSFTDSGLTSSTTYYYYPYFDDGPAQELGWVSGSGHGTNGRSFLSTQRSNLLSQAQNLQALIPLSNGPISGATTASGGGGGTGGGSGGCVRHTMLVEEKTKGIIAAFKVEVGDWLRNADGWTQVIFTALREQDLFIRVTVNQQSVEVTPTHPFNAMDENCQPIPTIEASRLSLMHQLFTTDGADFIESARLVKDQNGHKMVVMCEGNHTFFAGETLPYILTHNLQPT